MKNCPRAIVLHIKHEEISFVTFVTVYEKQLIITGLLGERAREIHLFRATALRHQVVIAELHQTLGQLQTQL
jgi:hypothetical protein